MQFCVIFVIKKGSNEITEIIRVLSFPRSILIELHLIIHTILSTGYEGKVLIGANTQYMHTARFHLLAFRAVYFIELIA